MAKYTIKKYVDAYVVYTTEVEAEDDDEAVLKARFNPDQKWEQHDTLEYDDSEFAVLDEDGNEIEYFDA